MSLAWQKWEQDLLERERAFERKPIARRTLKWNPWDWIVMLYAAVFLAALGAKCLGFLE